MSLLDDNSNANNILTMASVTLQSVVFDNIEVAHNLSICRPRALPNFQIFISYKNNSLKTVTNSHNTLNTEIFLKKQKVHESLSSKNYYP